MSGCATVPKETVQLSEIVGEQIEQMEVSHEGFVRLYYGRLRNDVNRFLVEKWIPEFLARAAQNEEFRRDHDIAYAVSRLDTGAVEITVRGDIPSDVRQLVLEGVQQAIQQQRAKLGEVLVDFGQSALEQIELQRAEMIGPIDEQERMVLTALREGYADIQRAQAAIEGLLESAVEVEREREVVLAKMQLLQAQRQIVESAVSASTMAGDALRYSAEAEEGIGAFMGALSEGQSVIESLRRAAAGVDLETEPREP